MENLKQQIESKIAKKLGADPGFRKALVENPRRAIEAELGIAIPAGVEVALREEGAAGISLTLTGGSEGTEIQDELLEQVAAGSIGPNPWG